MAKNDNIDVNRDGSITAEEVDVAKQKNEITIVRSKAQTQKKMAWVALTTMTVLTGIMFTPYVSDARVHALGDLIGLFYISMAGIVGAYMGVAAWMNSPKQQ